jgi:hypothetical protein
LLQVWFYGKWSEVRLKKVSLFKLSCGDLNAGSLSYNPKYIACRLTGKFTH